MPVDYYEWGTQTGGGGATPPVPTASNYGTPDPYVGTVAATGTSINFSSSTKSVTVRNTHAANSLQYSLDGSTWLTLGPYGEKTESANITTLLLRRIGGVVATYEVVGILM